MRHFFQLEGLLLLGTYLNTTWYFQLLPDSYYDLDKPINVVHELVIMDLFQTIMHVMEHKCSRWLYQKSHKPHHRYIIPELFDGSIGDTVLKSAVVKTGTNIGK